jgi:hypothetical protein
MQTELMDGYNVIGAGRDATGDHYVTGGRIYVEHRTIGQFESIRRLLPNVSDKTVGIMLDYAFVSTGYFYQTPGQEQRWINWASELFLKRPALQFVILPSPISPVPREAHAQPLGRVSPVADQWLGGAQPYDLVVLSFDTGAQWNPLWHAAQLAIAANSTEISMRQLAAYQHEYHPMVFFFFFRHETGLTELRRVLGMMREGARTWVFPRELDMLPAWRDQLDAQARLMHQRRRRREEMSEEEDDETEPKSKKPRFRCSFCGRIGVNMVYVNNADVTDMRYSCDRIGCHPSSKSM